MKVLFSDQVVYMGLDGSRYCFKDKYGNILLLREAKLVNQNNDIVFMFLQTSENIENIQYSFSSAKRLLVDLNDLRVPETVIATLSEQLPLRAGM